VVGLLIYLLTGFFWVVCVNNKITETAKGRPASIFMTWALNYFLWPVCMIVVLICKIKNKKVLFENK
jgi:hypothetical protein